MEPVKVVFGFLEKIECLFGHGKNSLVRRDAGKHSMECHRSSRQPGKWPSRYGSKDDLRRTSRVTIQNSLNPLALHSQKILCLRLRRLGQAISDGFSLSLSQSWWKSHLTCLGIIGGAHDIVIPALVEIARLYSRGLLLNASETCHGIFDEIDNIALKCRASQNARCKCSTTTRPSLKSGRKIEAVGIT